MRGDGIVAFRVDWPVTPKTEAKRSLAAAILCTLVLLLSSLTSCARSSSRFVSAAGDSVREIPLDSSADRVTARAAIVAEELTRMQGALAQVVRIHGSETLHKHEHHDLFVFLIRGKGTMRLANERVSLRTGDVVLVERGTPHAYHNADRDGSVALVISVPPARREDRVELERPER